MFAIYLSIVESLISLLLFQTEALLGAITKVTDLTAVENRYHKFLVPTDSCYVEKTLSVDRESDNLTGFLLMSFTRQFNPALRTNMLLTQRRMMKMRMA